MEEVDVLAGLQEDEYRWGDLQAIYYDKKRTDLFPEGYLGKLYLLCKSSRRRSGNGILDAIFGGNPPSDFDSIVSYLANRQVIVMGKWEGDTFHEIGFAFLIVTCGGAPPEKSIFAGYGFFKEFWGTEDMSNATMLGLAMLFKELDIKAIHGVRYAENLLTKKWTEKFGFRQIGEIPYYQLHEGKLVSGIVSTLLREDFVKYVEQFLLRKYREAHTPTIGTVEHPAVEESRATIDAQVERLAAGQITVVYLPFGSTYLPAIPEGMEMYLASSGPGAGVYFFNPQQVSQDEVAYAAADGSHGQLLGHTQNKAEIPPAARTIVVQAVDADGVVLRDSVVEWDAEAVAVQTEAFERMFPDCKIELKDPLEVIDARAKNFEITRVQTDTNLRFEPKPLPEVVLEEVAPSEQPNLPLSWL